MKFKILILAIILFPLFACSKTEKHSNTSFPNEMSFFEVPFRSSYLQVIQRKGKPFHDISKITSKASIAFASNIIYITNLNNQNYSLSYNFFNNQFFMGILMSEQIMNVSFWKNQYSEYSKYYQEQYGTPSAIKTNWNNSKYLNLKDDWDTALLNGYYNLITSWSNKNYELNMLLSGDGERVKIHIFLIDLELKDKWIFWQRSVLN